MKIAYFVHDLGDAAVHRRVRMLRHLADVTVLGFRRQADPASSVAGCPAVDLGRTFDARLLHRMGSVLRAWRGVRWQDHVAGADVVMARQLEMLALASAARRRAAPGAALVYECLDIHRLMLGHGIAGRVMRALEQRLLHGCDLLAVSSPAYLSEYFGSAAYFPHRTALPRSVILENKVLASEAGPMVAAPGGPPAVAPWRIGWFGIIRCRRSLLVLSALCRALPGRVEVVIRGRVSRNVIPDFDAVVDATPGMTFLGPYNRRTDLPQAYGAVHFNWAMDFYEAPGNSEWLLPNRLYEGSLYGTVPLGFAPVETGRWLARRGCGILVAEPLEAALAETFRTMDGPAYAHARAQVAALPRADLVEDDAAADNGLTAALAQIRRPAAGRQQAAGMGLVQETVP